MTNEEILKVKRILKENAGGEITISLLMSKLNIGFKKANYIIELLESENALDKFGNLKIANNKIDDLKLTDGSLIKHLDLLDDAIAIIKRDKEFNPSKVEEELNVRSNLMFDLIQELMRMGIIERFENTYRAKEA